MAELTDEERINRKRIGSINSMDEFAKWYKDDNNRKGN